MGERIRGVGQKAVQDDIGANAVAMARNGRRRIKLGVIV